MLTRRQFLEAATTAALAATTPALARAERRRERVLVVIELEGGNDGINTVVPFADPGYQIARDALRLREEDLHKLDDEVGLHPSMQAAKALYDDGRLALVEGVGYPEPNLSHFRSRAIWHSARLAREEHTGLGWLGRGLDERARAGDVGAQSLFVGAGPPPVAVRGKRAGASSLEQLSDFTLDPGAATAAAPASGARSQAGLRELVRRNQEQARSTSAKLAALAARTVAGADYPDSTLGTRLELIARLLRAGFEAPVLYTTHGGDFDTHASQLNRHALLLQQLSSALQIFLDDLRAARYEREVCVLVFSEFGRTVFENASRGTDHGSSGPLLLAGDAVRGGRHGRTPSLTDLVDRRLAVHVDFREVYASALGWLGLDPAPVVGPEFRPLELFA